MTPRTVFFALLILAAVAVWLFSGDRDLLCIARARKAVGTGNLHTPDDIDVDVFGGAP